MSTPTYIRPLLRRWYLVALGLLLTGSLAYSMSGSVAPTYTASASIVLVPGPGSIPENSNPFLYLGGLTQARDVLVQALSTRAKATEILGESTDATMSVGSDPTTSGPVILLSATASTPERATEVLTATEGALTRNLDSLQRQAGTAKDGRISGLVLSQDDVPQISGKEGLRTLIVLIVLGVGVTLALTAMIDALLRTGWLQDLSKLALERLRNRLRRPEVDVNRDPQASQPQVPEAGSASEPASSGTPASGDHDRLGLDRSATATEDLDLAVTSDGRSHGT